MYFNLTINTTQIENTINLNANTIKMTENTTNQTENTTNLTEIQQV
jgi:hypothetical protein